jgi:nucleoside-diphosphate-sugar epimerase
MASVLVTGGTGFIGSHLVEGLLEKGHQVRVIDNLANSRLDNIANVKDKIEFIEGSITDLETVEKAVQGVEYVFHQAALGSVPRSVKKPLDSHHANATGTLNIAIASQKAGVKRIISASSSAVYGGILEVPKREDMMPVPISPYGASKIAAEFYLETFYHLYGLESVSLRYSNVFGPRQNPDLQYAAVIPKFIKAIMNDQPPTIFGDGKQTRDFTFVKDVVNANILSMETRKTGGVPLNIARGEETTINQLVELLNKILGKDIKPVYTDPRPGDPLRATNDITRARELIGYEPKYTVEEGLRITADWYKGGNHDR